MPTLQRAAVQPKLLPAVAKSVSELARLATKAERKQASALLVESLGIDLLTHETQSGAEVSFVVWPETGPIKTVGGLVLHRDGVGFLYVPVGERRPTALDVIYAKIRQHAIESDAAVILLLTNEDDTYHNEATRYGFEYVGKVLTMRNDSPNSGVRMLARLCDQPTTVPTGPAGDRRLAELIQLTYVGSLSDPALGPEHDATKFLTRLRHELANHQDRFVYTIDGKDAAICLLSRHDRAGSITIRYLGVAPEFRGRKLGSKLLAASLASVWSDTYKTARMDVDEGNRYAVRIYQELGFKTISTAEEFVLRLR